jgi:hypothetical protein
MNLSEERSVNKTKRLEVANSDKTQRTQLCDLYHNSEDGLAKTGFGHPRISLKGATDLSKSKRMKELSPLPVKYGQSQWEFTVLAASY